MENGYGQGLKFFKGDHYKTNEKLPVGTYYYVFDYLDDQGILIKKTGYLYLKR